MIIYFPYIFIYNRYSSGCLFVGSPIWSHNCSALSVVCVTMCYGRLALKLELYLRKGTYFFFNFHSNIFVFSIIPR